jgi:hypothetical protein
MASAGHVVLDSACKQLRIPYCLRQQILPADRSFGDRDMGSTVRTWCMHLICRSFCSLWDVTCETAAVTEHGNESSGTIDSGVLHEQVRDRNNSVTFTNLHLCTTLRVLTHIYSSAPVSTGNTFQDLLRISETADNNESYLQREVGRVAQSV